MRTPGDNRNQTSIRIRIESQSVRSIKTLKTLTKDEINQRDMLIFGCNSPRYAGGIARFENMSCEVLEKLLELEFADPKETQNNSPTIKQFLTFMQKYPKFKAIGYVVSPDRDDCRVTIEGLKANENLTAEEIAAFAIKFHNADEFDVTLTSARCWYD